MNKLRLEIVTPETPVLEKDVDFVALPAYEGELGVLPGHIPLVVQLKEGLLHYRLGKEREEFAVLGGFAEISGKKVSVFAESAALASQINEEEALQAARKAKAVISSGGAETEIEAARIALMRALAFSRLARRVGKLRGQAR